jgi:CheY-like chemotaxis protein
MQQSEVVSLTGLRVIVVDDEVSIRDFVALLLEDAGAETMIAASVQEALAQISTFHPTLVVSDIKMPDANGFDLIRELQRLSAAEQRSIAAIAMSASNFNVKQEEVLAAGFAAYLAKPFGREDLMAAVNRALQSLQ